MNDQLPPARRVRTPLGDASTNMEGYVHAESQALKLAKAALGEHETIDDLAEALRSATELIGRFESLLARLRYCDTPAVVAAEHTESPFLPLGVAAERQRETCADWLREHRP